jgi:hypothetical protein
LKDFLLGRGTSISDRMYESLWALSLIMNKYTYYQFKMNGAVGGMRAAFGPPMIGTYFAQDFFNRDEQNEKRI